MGLLYPNAFRNPLAYPVGVAPGFDASHPAAGGIGPEHGFSGTAMAGGFVSLLSGAVATKGGAPVPGLNATIGPDVVFSNAAHQYTLAGQSTASDAAYTCGGIFYVTTFSNNNYLFVNSSTNAGCTLRFTSTGQVVLIFVGQGNGVTSTFTLSASTPYFVAGSRGATTGDIIAVNLITGQVSTFSATVTTTSPSAVNGTYTIGNNAGSQINFAGGIAAVMYAPQRISLATMLQWAADPWAFWYPDPGDNWIAAQAGSSFLAAWAQNNNQVIGTGLY